jgi:two-component system sensor histidine kinase GlrK
VSFTRPRSIVRLIVIAFAAVAIPLIVAVVTAVIQVDRLAQRGRRAVLDAEVATQESRALVEHLTAMERSLGQYYVLGDRDFYVTYRARRDAFFGSVRRLASLETAAARGDRLQAILAAENELNRQLLTPDGKPMSRISAADIGARWASLNNQARAILAESSKLIEVEANNARRAAERLQRTLVLQTAAAVPVALLLGALFFWLITRPLRRIDGEIRRLGSGDFSSPVSIRGPQDLEELSSRLDWLRRRIVELEEQKANFLRHISHELKTPLTSIREGSELLMDESHHRLSNEQKEIAQIMRESSQHLQRLIEDLLEFGKTQVPRSGAPRMETVRLDEIVRSAFDSHSLGRTAKGVHSQIALEPVSIAGDPDQLRIVVDNLLSNAIKYTPAGGELDVSLAARDGAVFLEVSDSGPGVEPAERERVFEPFYQGNAPYAGYVQGTGLGLTIARQYVTAHSGQIEITESRFGKGACVRVTLPNVQASDVQAT